jgi:DNA-binding HxlR family transcriptional regulator
MTKIKDTSTNFENKVSLSNECPGIYAANLIGGRWTLAICCYLRDGKLRFGELRKCLPKITERMLTLELRKMEQNKLVKRTIYAQVPPKVEYELTDIGMEISPILTMLEKWGKKHQEVIEHNPLL